MSSLVHTVVSDVIASQERPQHQSAKCAPPSHLDSNNNTGGDFVVNGNKDKSAEAQSVKSTIQAGSSGDKYSLRPRSFLRRSDTEDPNHTGATATRRSARRCGSSGIDCTTRPKQKPPPLSKYRRKTANARERDRMREINAAFETLRRAVPHVSSAHQNQHDNNSSEKLTKITTLRLAMKYIATLSQALQQPATIIPTLLPPTSISSNSSCSTSGNQQVILGNKSLNFHEHCLTPSDFAAPDFTRQCHNPPTSTHLSSSDHIQHKGTLLLNKHQSLISSYYIHKAMRTPSQNNPSSESGTTAHCVAPDPLGDLCDDRLTTDLSPECLLSPALGQQCHHASSSSSQLCLSAPVLEPPDLSHHCLSPADFQEHTNKEQPAFVTFDDDSLDSPDLDHLLISWHQYVIWLSEVSALWLLEFQDLCLWLSILV